MSASSKILSLVALLLLSFVSFSQTDSISISRDSLNIIVQEKLLELESQRQSDSLEKAELEEQLKSLKTTDNIQKEELLDRLKAIDEKEKQRIQEKIDRINAYKAKASGYPVTGILSDTLFSLYTKIGAVTAKERAANIIHKIQNLYNDDFLVVDSIQAVKSDNMYDVVYNNNIIMSVSENDALWQGTSTEVLANQYTETIKSSLVNAKETRSTGKILMRVGLMILVLLVVFFIFWLIKKGHARLDRYLVSKKDVWLKNLSYKEYVFMTAEQEMKAVIFATKLLRWLIYAILLYITLPIIFSIFPFSRNWADTLFHLIWMPFKSVLNAVWSYLPNLFSILVIYYVMKYFIKIVKYFFGEIENGKLTISGFHSDWAKPTFSIVRFLLYAFMFVMIYPFLPGSDSDIFKGVSVFVGILFSLGSSSAIANMVSGLVITYMRPFKIGDRIKIADVTGDVIEKSLLVTRVRTPKNEIITIPNSSVLTGNTTNYTVEAENNGLIIYSTVTIGYDVPWRLMHEALLEAASRTEHLLKEPKPFVLQTSLDDFYVSYQINAYTREASKQASIYSLLHQNIQDACNEKGIEILSPHYRAGRDGNMTTIPANYLPKDYEAPRFRVDMDKKKD